MNLKKLAVLAVLAVPQIHTSADEKISLAPVDAAALVDSIAEEYFSSKFALYPHLATAKGLTDYDSLLSTFSPRGVSRFLMRIRRLQTSLVSFEADSLDVRTWIDLKTLECDMAAEALLVGDWEAWRRSPLLYAGACIDGIYYITLRYSPPDVYRRLRARLARVPEALEQARVNLTRPVRLHCEVAQMSIARFVPFLDSLKWAGGVPAPREDVELLDRAKHSLEAFHAYLDSALAGADPDFALGTEAFESLLATGHLIEESPDELVRYAERVLADAEAELGRLDESDESAPLDVDRAALLAKDDVIRYFYAEIDSARAFIIRRDLMTLAEDAPVRVIETPGFLRALVPSYAYEPAGPYDRQRVGMLYVSLPDTLDLSARIKYAKAMQARDHRGAVVHEVYPGHHAQIEAANRTASLTRQLAGDLFAVEGWALYCEEMMASQGYYGLEGRSKVLRGIIFRAARVIVDVRLQTRQFTLAQAVDFMVNHTGGSREFMEKEVARYAVAPTQAMSYLIGKREITRLRDQYMRLKGQAFSLRDFHDTLLRCGSIPPYLLRVCVLAEAMGRR